jgi:hypothetical protein
MAASTRRVSVALFAPENQKTFCGAVVPGRPAWHIENAGPGIDGQGTPFPFEKIGQCHDEFREQFQFPLRAQP